MQLDISKSVSDTLHREMQSEQSTSNPLKLYAVMDAAIIDMLPVYLEGFGVNYVCLLSGKSADELSEVAPYLIECRFDTNAYDWLSGDAIHLDGCIFILSNESLRGL